MLTDCAVIGPDALSTFTFNWFETEAAATVSWPTELKPAAVSCPPALTPPMTVIEPPARQHRY